MSFRQGVFMKREEHKYLSRYLYISAERKTTRLQHLLLTFGSVAPDLSPVSYIRGFFQGNPFKSHFWCNSQKLIKRYIRQLSKKKEWHFWDYFRFGELTHYLADAFTYPHNDFYPGTMFDHLDYEEVDLHNVFAEVLDTVPSYEIEETEESFWEQVLEMHKEYEEAEHGPESDVRFIHKVNYAAWYCLVPCQGETALEKFILDAYEEALQVHDACQGAREEVYLNAYKSAETLTMRYRIKETSAI